MILKNHVTRRIDSCIAASDPERKDSAPEENRAYVSLIYGRDPPVSLIANAMAMANSIRDSKYQRVLLCTPDVPAEYLCLLEDSGLFTSIREVDYILADRSLFKKDWFREVFTKLHVFNLTDFSKVLFLDLDTLVVDMSRMDQLFDLECQYAAMENSKRPKSGSMWLRHGAPMKNHCQLINAGVMLITPNKQLFHSLLEDVTNPSPDHVPGMTPEQFYLARIMGHHFTHISQHYNFEVQFHGGVPITDTWKKTSSISEIVCLHFSGASPLTVVSRQTYPPAECGAQIEKYFVRKSWESDFEEETRQRANIRAIQAFDLWRSNLVEAVKRIETPSSYPLLEKFLFTGPPSSLSMRAALYLSRRLLCSPAVEQQPSVVTKTVKKCSIFSRFKSFASGAVFASAVGMYVLTFQLQGLLDEVRSAVHDVSVRQQVLESKLANLSKTE